ncbi:MAG: imidazole glycerol phosphate synthase subunit HisH [Planctomycetota bacterium]|nr:MAG: imidazole glycerol phosphate synthase subunit HisH [Planctomycetota bacterium]
MVATGTANVASVVAAFERLGARPRPVERADEVRTCERLVLPGVGAFGAAARGLVERGLFEPLRERIASGGRTLAICVGMQLLFEGSEESPDATGLGILPGRLERFDDALEVPQMGWNRMEAAPGCRWLETGWVYFANSFRRAAEPGPLDEPLSRGAHAEYGGRFLAGCEWNECLACQFHPELSGAVGRRILARWWEE